jgi:hypothetical protein
MKPIFNDRRQSFRLNIPIIVGYKSISDEKFESAKKKSISDKNFMVSENKELNLAREIQYHVSQIKQKISDKPSLKSLETAENNLNQLIGLLSNNDISSEGILFPNEHNEAVNLSADGIAFCTHELLATDKKFILKMALSSETVVYVFCTTIDSILLENTPMATEKQAFTRAHFVFFIGNGKQILSNFLEKKLNDKIKNTANNGDHP